MSASAASKDKLSSSSIFQGLRRRSSMAAIALYIRRVINKGREVVTVDSFSERGNGLVHDREDIWL